MSLRPDDALKLYELAYFGKEDVLEIGTGGGLSSSILSLALHDAQERTAAPSNVLSRLTSRRVHTVDLSDKKLQVARRNLAGQPAEKSVVFTREMASLSWTTSTSAEVPSTWLLSIAHAYQDVFPVCERLGDCWINAPCRSRVWQDTWERRAVEAVW